mmetsp:Transcript_12561/g.44491  ORF Transcript_12561/g.44491 Transcript_12561/m.44491 type:complete len:1305 (-) Transcript_12561:35-3949(-)
MAVAVGPAPHIRGAGPAGGDAPDCLTHLFEPRAGAGIELVLQATHAAPEIHEVQEYGCSALRAAAAEGRANQDLIGALSGIEIIIEALRSHSNVDKVQSAACGALGNLAHDHDENKARIIELGGIELVIRALRAFGPSDEVQNWGCAALRHLTHGSHEGRRRTAAGGGAEVVLVSMQAHPNQPMVQGGGCALLGHLAHECVEDRIHVIAAGALPAILRALRSHPELARVQACGCAALGNLFVTGSATAGSGTGGGDDDDGDFDSEAPTPVAMLKARPPPAPREGVELAVQALRAHPEDIDVQGCAFAALQGLSAEGPEIRQHMADVGGVEAMMTAMVNYSTLVKVQSSGMLVLARMCGDSKEHCARLASNPQSVLIAMEVLREDVRVQEAGCLMLGRLSTYDSGWRLGVVRAGAVPSVLEAMQVHPSYARLQATACEAVRWCMEECAEGEAAVVSHGGIAVLLSTLALHPLLLRAHRDAWLVLETLAGRGAGHRAEEAAQGVLEIARDAAHCHAQEVDIQRCCCNIITWLTGDYGDHAESRSQLFAMGLVATMLEALAGHLQVAAVQTVALEGLSLLVRDLSDARADAASNGALEFCVAALSTHPADVSVQRSACAAVRDLATGEVPSRRRFLALGASDLVLAALVLHVTDIGVQERGLLALLALAEDGQRVPLLGVDGPLGGVAEALGPYQEEELDEDTDPMALKRKVIVRSALAAVSLHLPTRLSARGGVAAALAAMRTHAAALEVQRPASAVLRRIAAVGAGHKLPSTSGAAVRGDIAARGGGEVVAEAMRAHGALSSDLQESCCGILGLMAASGLTIRSDLVALGANKLVVRALQQHHSVVELQVVVCSTLHSLGLELPESQAQIVEVGALPLVLQTLRASADDERVQVAGFVLLQQLAAREDCAAVRAQMVELGGLEVALDALLRHPVSIQVLARAFEVLCLLCLDGPEPRARAVEHRGLELTLATMRFLIDDADSQERGCVLLDALAGDSLQLRARLLVQATNGLQSVLQAGARKVQRKQVQFLVCALVLKLASDSGESRQRAGSIGACEGVLAAMLAFPKKTDIEACACNALLQLSNRCAENVNRIAAAGGVKTVCLAMFKGEKCLELQEAGLGVLRFLMADSEEIPEEVTDLGGLQIVVGALETFPDSLLVQEHGLSCISHLCWHNPENQETVVLKEGVELALAALRAHGERPKVVAFACAALQSIANEHKKHREVLGKCGAIELILEAMKAHPEAANVQAYACAALQSIACSSFANRRTIMQGGAEDLAISAMELHPRSWKLQEFAQMLLDTFET